MKHCKKKVYGLTGGISTGKSTVSDILREKGYPIVDMDKISRQIFEKDKPAYKDTIEEFGRGILDKNLEINREKLREIVFSNEDRLESLNRITHPYIMKESKSLIEEILKTRDLVIVDIPLLLETRTMLRKYGINFTKIILVYVDRETQIIRLMERDKISREDALKIISSQMSIEDKRDLVDYIIDNRGSLESLYLEVEKLMEKLK